MNPFFKSTKGYNAEVVVAKSVAYTTDATYALFVANAVEGEVGVFNAGTNAAFLGNGVLSAPKVPTLKASTTGGVLAAATYFYKIVALNSVGSTVGSPEASQATTGSTSSIAVSWLDVAGATSYRIYKGTSAGAESAYFESADNSFLDKGEAGIADTVRVTNTATTIDAIKIGTIVFIAQKRDSAIYKTEPFEVQSNIATWTNYAAGALNTWTVEAAGLTVAKGTVLEVALIELTTGSQPYHPFNFYVIIKLGETLAQGLARLNAIIADPKNPQWYAFGQIATSSLAGTVLTITAKETGRFFKVVVRQGLEDAVLVQTVAPALGNGSYEGIAAIEEEGAIFDGVTTNYPMHGVPSEYGTTTKFAAVGVNYDVLMLVPERSQLSPMPFHKHTHKSYIFVAVPTSGTSPKSILYSMFGF